MHYQRIKTRFMHLSNHAKLIALGAFLATISVFMPWYEDLDAFRTGDLFLGITGPLYLAGFIILAASALSLSLIVVKVFEKKSPKLPMKESHTHISVAALNMFLLILVNSVYFHDKFGVNIALKESRFGMIVAFAGSIILFFAAVMQERSSVPDFNISEGKLEPLIDMQKTRRVQRDIRDTYEDSVEDEKYAIKASVNSTLDNNSVKSDDPTDKAQPWRMDL